MTQQSESRSQSRLDVLLDKQIALLEAAPKGQSYEAQFKIALQCYREVAELALEMEAAKPSEIEGKLARFAAKCRPSVAHYMRTQERAAMSIALSLAGKQEAEKEAAWLGRLLDEIDSLTDTSSGPHTDCGGAHRQGEAK